MSYRDSKRSQGTEVEVVERDPGEDFLTCQICTAPTKRKDLAMYGARCFACYQRYCLTDPQWPEIPKDLTGPRAWIARLEARQRAGERLSKAQTDALERVRVSGHASEGEA